MITGVFVLLFSIDAIYKNMTKLNTKGVTTHVCHSNETKWHSTFFSKRNVCAYMYTMLNSLIYPYTKTFVMLLWTNNNLSEQPISITFNSVDNI